MLTTASLLFLIYWKRRKSSLLHLDKHHKESEENSYSSSKNSRDSSPKGGDSFDPVYDEIKLKSSSHRNKSAKAMNTENVKPCTDEDEHNDPHYSMVSSKAGSQYSKEAVPSGFDQGYSKPHQKSHTSCEKISNHPNDPASMNDIDKGESEKYETHTYASVDVKKKKSENIKIHECNHLQEVCTPDSGGGTPPAVPPHTPEMLLNDSNPNSSQDERGSMTKD